MQIFQYRLSAIYRYDIRFRRDQRTTKGRLLGVIYMQKTSKLNNNYERQNYYYQANIFCYVYIIT